MGRHAILVHNSRFCRISVLPTTRRRYPVWSPRSPRPQGRFMHNGTLAPTPLAWRAAIASGVVLLTGVAYFGASILTPRGQSAVGVVCFLGVAAVFSANLRALNWRTLAWGFGLQVLLALFVLKFEVNGVRPGYKF